MVCSHLLIKYIKVTDCITLPMITALGLFAACLTTGALIPQVVKTWRTKSTGDLSLSMYLMMFTGILCWFVYGWIQLDIPIIFANGVASIFSGIILYFKVMELKKKPR